jgi:hypothetical protein
VSRFKIFYSLSCVYLIACTQAFPSQTSWINFINFDKATLTDQQVGDLNDVEKNVEEKDRQRFFSQVRGLSSKTTKLLKDSSLTNTIIVFLAQELLNRPNLPGILKRMRYCHPSLRILESACLQHYHNVIETFASLDKAQNKKISRFVRKTVGTRKVECQSYGDLLAYILFFRDHLNDKYLKWYSASLNEVPEINP